MVGAPPGQIGTAALGPLLQPVSSADSTSRCPATCGTALDLLLNTGVVYPLMRALHGRRVRCQFGVDFAFSNRLFAGPLQAATPARLGTGQVVRQRGRVRGAADVPVESSGCRCRRRRKAWM